jgi:hypothetical protein
MKPPLVLQGIPWKHKKRAKTYLQKACWWLGSTSTQHSNVDPS